MTDGLHIHERPGQGFADGLHSRDWTGREYITPLLRKVLQHVPPPNGGAAAGAITSGNTAANATIPGGSAATAATSGDITVAAALLSSYVVVYADQTQHKAIHIMVSAADRGISSGTEEFEWYP